MSSGPSKVIVLDPDPRAGRQIQLGFEREGVPTYVPALPAAAASVDQSALVPPDGGEPGIVLVGGKDGQALELVRRARALLAAQKADVPIVFTGRGPSRAEVETAGADEVVARPAYLRDIITIARMLRGVPRGQRDHLVGSLVETTNVLTLVRAFSVLGRSAVLTLIRGLRRGEVRFYRGEVTSAQVGLIHGQAALHQLLLWTDARFDYSHEDIVRRQQIPLTPDELFADAERFLEGVRECAGNLSPSTVLEQDVQRIQMFGKQIPTEVHGVLRMFDGHRVLADILEDSPYRVFETLRVAQKAVEVGLLRLVKAQRSKATWRAVLAIEEWLVGNETRDAVVERTAALDSGPVSSAHQTQPRKKLKKGKRGKKPKPLTPPPESKDIDWGALVPRVIGAEVGPLSGVVPAMETHGEVELPTRDKPREGLEALMDTDKRHRIFPTDIGLEPKVVIAGGDSGEWERAALDAKRKADVVDKAAADRALSAQRAEADAYVLGETAAKLKARAGAEIGSADTPPAGLPVVKPAAAEPKPEPKAEVGTAKAEPAPVATEPASVTQAGDKPEAAPVTAEATPAEPEPAPIATPESAPIAKPEAAQVAKAEPTEPTAASTVTPKPAGLDAGHKRAKLATLPTTPPGAEEIDPATAAIVAVPQYLGPMKSDPHAAVIAVPAEVSEPRSHRAGATDAKELVRALVAEVLPTDPAAPQASSGNGAPVRSEAITAPVRPTDDQATTPFLRPNLDDSPAAPFTKPTADEASAPFAKSPEDQTGKPYIKQSADDSLAFLRPMPGAATDDDVSQPPVKPTADDSGGKPFIRPTADEIADRPNALIAEPTTIAEGPRTSVAVTDVVTVRDAGDTAVVTAKPATLISEQPTTTTVASLEPARTVVRRDTPAPIAKVSDATPEPAEDEPSDGVVRSMIATADTARLLARAAQARPPAPEHDGPPIKETTGEIRERPRRKTIEPSIAAEPSILVADDAAAASPAATVSAAHAAAKEPAVSEPSMLVADLAAAHRAIAAVSTKVAATPAPADSATPSRELEVADVRRDAVAFSEAEEAFFSGADKSVPVHRVHEAESFDDLDEGYQPPKFWDRVFGRKPKKP